MLNCRPPSLFQPAKKFRWYHNLLLRNKNKTQATFQGRACNAPCKTWTTPCGVWIDKDKGNPCRWREKNHVASKMPVVTVSRTSHPWGQKSPGQQNGRLTAINSGMTWKNPRCWASSLPPASIRVCNYIQFVHTMALQKAPYKRKMLLQSLIAKAVS